MAIRSSVKQLRDEVLGRRHWLAVINENNYASLSSLGHPFFALRRSPKISDGDYCILYRGGSKAGFVGVFEFRGTVQAVSVPAVLRKFTVFMPWKAIVLSEDDPVPMSQVLSELSFIYNKSKYGMHLRNAFQEIPKADFEIIQRSLEELSHR
jgi:hypothetical protein